LNPDTQGTAN